MVYQRFFLFKFENKILNFKIRRADKQYIKNPKLFICVCVCNSKYFLQFAKKSFLIFEKCEVNY